MSTLTLKSITKFYGTLQVLHGIDLEVRDGEFVALVGPSGCGKSTLLRMIAGLDSVTGGEIWLNGICVNEVAPKDRGVAMVFQSYALYPHMTVRENMGFALRMAGMPKAEAAAQIDRAAEILGLSQLMQRRPKELSGGQMQRVAMGRAIVRNPSLFLFDEPLSNLDAKLRHKVRGEIQALHLRLGTTTVYVTHDQVEAMTLADRIVVMNEGRVEQTGTPLQLYDRPQTPFVAGFIGSPAMNLFTGTLAGSALRLASGLVLEMPDAIPKGLAGEVSIGIRPEHLSRAGSGWPMQVQIVETMGAESHVSGLIGAQEATLTVKTRDFPAIGSVIRLRPDPGALHVFQNGERRE